ncbi:TetR/AcrR family transcriptional regulator [Pseudomonas sp. F1_0610]|uniref:TetR/AcrR family transcriptional regulator n=1 Tax=Pseudomonas sp. F1_0610 TaxID=3114284 RepID=UPI0039C2DA17
MNKRQQLIDSAFKLFYQNSVNAVGINLILKSCGIAKKTLYSYFPSKDDLVLATINDYSAHFLDWFNAHLSSALPGKRAIFETFNALDRWINNQEPELPAFHGCYIVKIATEFTDPTHFTQSACQQHFARLSYLIKQQLDLAKVKESKQDQLTESLTLLLLGAITQSSLLQQKNSALTAQQMAFKLLKKFKE